MHTTMAIQFHFSLGPYVGHIIFSLFLHWMWI